MSPLRKEDGPAPAPLVDGGGWAYYYDPHDKRKRGAFALFFIGYGTLTFEDSRFVGKDLGELLDHVLAGDDFRAWPMLGT